MGTSWFVRFLVMITDMKDGATVKENFTARNSRYVDVYKFLSIGYNIIWI